MNEAREARGSRARRLALAGAGFGGATAARAGAEAAHGVAATGLDHEGLLAALPLADTKLFAGANAHTGGASGRHGHALPLPPLSPAPATDFGAGVPSY